MLIAVIPARAGSKRIPNKNIKPIDGSPVLVRAIDILKRSNLFDRIIVSTDDQQIQSIATKAGAEVPFVRPPSLSNDDAGTLSVVQHAIKALNFPKETAICCFYSTAILLNPEHLRASFKRLADHPKDFIFAAQPFSHPIERALLLDQTSSVINTNPTNLLKRTQDCVPRVHDAGQFYWGLASTWLGANSILRNGSHAFLLNPTEAIDVDTREDWTLLEAMFQMRKNLP